MTTALTELIARWRAQELLFRDRARMWHRSGHRQLEDYHTGIAATFAMCADELATWRQEQAQAVRLHQQLDAGEAQALVDGLADVRAGRIVPLSDISALDARTPEWLETAGNISMRRMDAKAEAVRRPQQEEPSFEKTMLSTLLLDCIQITEARDLVCRHCEAGIAASENKPIPHESGCVVGQIQEMQQQRLAVRRAPLQEEQP